MYIYVTKTNYIPYIGVCDLVRGSGSLWISLHSGATYPYEDWYEDTFCFNSVVNIEYRFRYRYALVAEFAYNDFRWHDPSGRFPWWNISGTARYFFPAKRVQFFINVGPGVYIPDEGSARLGLKAGLGINYPLNDRLILEAGTDYHTIFPVNKSVLYQDKHTSFQHFHIGLVYRLTK
jgi:opacity protein-like surface antigen